jgi:hypothetical protein
MNPCHYLNTWLSNQTNDFKNALSRAKELAASLPGGELRIGEQDEIIEMLETLKNRKRYVLCSSAYVRCTLITVALISTVHYYLSFLINPYFRQRRPHRTRWRSTRWRPPHFMIRDLVPVQSRVRFLELDASRFVARSQVYIIALTALPGRTYSTRQGASR